MFEKIKSSLKKNSHIRKLKKISEAILTDSSCDYFDKLNHPHILQILIEILNDFLKVERYEALKNKNNLTNLIREKFISLGLLERKIYERLNGENHSGDNDSPTGVVSPSATILTYPCLSLSPHAARNAIKMAFIRTLTEHYPLLLNNKTALTLMCIRKFHPQSFFAKMPKDIIKLILKYAENSEVTKNPLSHTQCRR